MTGFPNSDGLKMPSLFKGQGKVWIFFDPQRLHQINQHEKTDCSRIYDENGNFQAGNSRHHPWKQQDNGADGCQNPFSHIGGAFEIPHCDHGKRNRTQYAGQKGHENFESGGV